METPDRPAINPANRLTVQVKINYRTPPETVVDSGLVFVQIEGPRRADNARTAVR